MIEFSKSLRKRAYSWFVNLPANSIRSCDKLAAAFCTKFFVAESKIDKAELAYEAQRRGENLSNYETRFKERALDFYIHSFGIYVHWHVCQWNAS